MKDLRIEVATTARAIIAKTDGMYRDSRKRFVSSGNVFNVVATDVSDYDGVEITVCISTHTVWSSAEKALKTKAQELTFEERAKAFDRVIAQRVDGKIVDAEMKAVYEAIKAEEASENTQRISEITKREYRHESKSKRQHQLRQKRHYKLH